MKTLQKQQEDSQESMLKVQELRHIDMKEEVVREMKTQREEHRVQRKEDRVLTKQIMTQVEQSRDETRSIRTGLEDTTKTLGQQEGRITKVLDEARAWQKEQEELSRKWREERELAWRKMREEQKMWMRDQMASPSLSRHTCYPSAMYP